MCQMAPTVRSRKNAPSPASISLEMQANQQIPTPGASAMRELARMLGAKAAQCHWDTTNTSAASEGV